MYLCYYENPSYICIGNSNWTVCASPYPLAAMLTRWPQSPVLWHTPSIGKCQSRWSIRL